MEDKTKTDEPKIEQVNTKDEHHGHSHEDGTHHHHEDGHGHDHDEDGKEMQLIFYFR